MSICEMLLCSHDEVHSSMIYTVTLKGTISKNNVCNKGKKVDLHEPECLTIFRTHEDNTQIQFLLSTYGHPI